MPYKRRGSFASSSNKRARTRNMYRRKRKFAPYRARGRLQRAIKRVVLRTTEVKRKPVAPTKKELYHNTPLVVTQPLGSGHMPTQGDGDAQRIGDAINLSGFRIRAMFGQKFDRPNVTMKMWIVESNLGDTYTYNTFFRNITGNTLLDDINTDRIKILKSYVFKPPVGTTNTTVDSKEYTYVRKFWLPYKRKVKFLSDGGTDTNLARDMHVIVAAYDAYGTLTTDNIGYVQMFVDTYYRDP